jgi:DNA-binding transcriptional ArsR family regulator
MSGDARREPESFQVVSDLGQLTAFADPLKMRIIRILQQQEATTNQLVDLIDEKRTMVSGQIRALRDLGLINVVHRKDHDGARENVYRATARVYNLRPEPMTTGSVSASVASATLDSVSKELVGSLKAWPNQKMNYEGRRARMPYERAVEFNDKLEALISEYWGSPSHPVEENPDDPMLALIAAWYRFPEEV